LTRESSQRRSAARLSHSSRLQFALGKRRFTSASLEPCGERLNVCSCSLPRIGSTPRARSLGLRDPRSTSLTLSATISPSRIAVPSASESTTWSRKPSTCSPVTAKIWRCSSGVNVGGSIRTALRT
jgi:hypothetical protein